MAVRNLFWSSTPGTWSKARQKAFTHATAVLNISGHRNFVKNTTDYILQSNSTQSWYDTVHNASSEAVSFRALFALHSIHFTFHITRVLHQFLKQLVFCFQQVSDTHSHLLSCLHLGLSEIKSFNCPSSFPSIISCNNSFITTSSATCSLDCVNVL